MQKGAQLKKKKMFSNKINYLYMVPPIYATNLQTYELGNFLA